MDILWFFFCLVFAMPKCAGLVVRCRSAGKGLTSWFTFVVSNCAFCHFPLGILCQV